MADKILSFKAQDIPQITRIEVGGTPAAGNTATVPCNQKKVTVTVVTGATALEDVAASIAWAINSEDATGERTDAPNVNTKNIGGQRYGEFRDMWARSEGAFVYLTSTKDGTPFTVSTEVTGGGVTLTQTEPQAATGKEWINEPTNYIGGVAPVAGDDIIARNSSISLKYGLDGLVGGLQSFTKESTYTGDVGLPEINTTHSTAPYEEYRPQAIEFKFSIVTTFRLNLGSVDSERDRADGVFRVLFPTADLNPDVYIYDAPSRDEDGRGSVQIRGGLNLDVFVRRGSVDIGTRLGDPISDVKTVTASWRDERATDVDVILGDESRFNNTGPNSINQSGGVIKYFSSAAGGGPIPTWYIQSGIGYSDGNQPITTINIDTEGQFWPISFQATDVNVYPGGTINTDLWDGTGSMSVSSNITVHKGSTVIDRLGTLKPTNGFKYEGTWPGDPDNTSMLGINGSWTVIYP